jgi:hypothetical protein
LLLSTTLNCNGVGVVVVYKARVAFLGGQAESHREGDKILPHQNVSRRAMLFIFPSVRTPPPPNTNCWKSVEGSC